jgi:tartrate dehydrogenase/decarboxylase / D-malate dehydrogenase
MLLDDLGRAGPAKAVRTALAATLRSAHHHTPDLGGTASTSQLAAAVLHEMESR